MGWICEDCKKRFNGKCDFLMTQVECYKPTLKGRIKGLLDRLKGVFR